MSTTGAAFSLQAHCHRSCRLQQFRRLLHQGATGLLIGPEGIVTSGSTGLPFLTRRPGVLPRLEESGQGLRRSPAVDGRPKRLDHPVVADLDLSYEVMELALDAGLRLALFTAAPAAVPRRLSNLLANWWQGPSMRYTLDRSSAAPSDRCSCSVRCLRSRSQTSSSDATRPNDLAKMPRRRLAIPRSRGTSETPSSSWVSLARCSMDCAWRDCLSSARAAKRRQSSGGGGGTLNHTFRFSSVQTCASWAARLKPYRRSGARQ